MPNIELGLTEIILLGVGTGRLSYWYYWYV